MNSREKKKALLAQESLYTLCKEMMDSECSEEEERKALEKQLTRCSEAIMELNTAISGAILS